MVCQDVGVELGASEEVASYFCMVCQMVPQLEREVDVHGAESTNEVVFEGLDGAFCGVDAMIVGFDELNCTVLGGDTFFDGSRSLVICDIEGGSESFSVRLSKMLLKAAMMSSPFVDCIGRAKM